jgi:predicted secreted hydrolase
LVDSTSVYGYRVHYWEGRCRVVGTRAGKSVRGQSYTELIGYGTAPVLPSLTP